MIVLVMRFEIDLSEFLVYSKVFYSFVIYFWYKMCNFYEIEVLFFFVVFIIFLGFEEEWLLYGKYLINVYLINIII